MLAATGADDEGLTFFNALAARQPDQPLPLALAGYFQVRTGQDVEAGVARLNDAAARDLGPAQYFRGLALAGLPAESGHPQQAVADLEFVLAVRDQFPTPMIRAVYKGLAAAYAATGQQNLAAQATADSGLSPAPPDTSLEFGGGWANPVDGYHFTSPRLVELSPGVTVAQGYDFGDFAFIRTTSGVVAIDSGTSGHRVAAALTAASLRAEDVSHVILTHAHFDHAGGISALTGSSTQVIAQANFPSELEHQHANPIPFRYFTGARTDAASPDIKVDHLIAEQTKLSIGGTEFVLYPTTGGETSDALMIYLPASGVLFAGDAMMPYLGAPFFAEGSPDGLLDALALITEIGPRVLVHGHTTLTELFPASIIPGLRAALTELRGQTLAGIAHGLTLTALLKANVLPELLREHPAAVNPYLVTRDHFIQRLHHQHTGYWQPDGEGLEPYDASDRAAALDLLADGKPEQFAKAARTLLAQDDPALALEIGNAGLLTHPDSNELSGLRRQALHRLMERYQLQDPFRFLIYADLAGVELGPVAP